jgi:hypothetical protein
MYVLPYISISVLSSFPLRVLYGVLRRRLSPLHQLNGSASPRPVQALGRAMSVPLRASWFSPLVGAKKKGLCEGSGGDVGPSAEPVASIHHRQEIG